MGWKEVPIIGIVRQCGSRQNLQWRLAIRDPLGSMGDVGTVDWLVALSKHMIGCPPDVVFPSSRVKKPEHR